jgi:hypothetical protein
MSLLTRSDVRTASRAARTAGESTGSPSTSIRVRKTIAGSFEASSLFRDRVEREHAHNRVQIRQQGILRADSGFAN